MAYGNYGEQGNPKRGGPGGGADPELSASIRAAKLARHGPRPWWKFWAPRTTPSDTQTGPEDPQTPVG